jgi:polyisoprenoid-binding protein YceI
VTCACAARSPIGGSFEARSRALSGSLTGEPGSGAFAGSLAVDLRTLDTGIGLRNDHMRDRYLEVHKGEGYDHAVLSDVRLANPAVEASGGTSPFTAALQLHGLTRPIAGEARLSSRGSDVRVEASFPLDLTEFGIESPRYLGVGVRDQVTVRVTFTAAPAS